MSGRRIVTVAVLTAMVGVLGCASAHALTWSRPEAIQPRGSEALNAVSCPSARLCVAVDDRGAVLTSTTPTRHGRWTRRATDVSPNGKRASLSAVACAGMSLCVAVDHEGGILSSTHPTRSGSWHRAKADPGYTLTGVSCPSRHLCVAVDTGGNAVSSLNPAAGARAWRRANFSGDLRAIACPSTTLCVVTQAYGSVFASTNPTGGAHAWRDVSDEGNPFGEGSAACGSKSLCVAGDFYGGLLSSTRPATHGWHHATIFPWLDPTDHVIGLTAASCASNRLCVAIYAVNGPRGAGPSAALVSRRPANPNSWVRGQGQIDGATINGISCPSTRVCVAVDARGRAVVGEG